MLAALRSLPLNDKTGYGERWALAKAYYCHQQYDQALRQEALTESNGKAPEIELLVAQCLTAAGRYEDSAQAIFSRTTATTHRPRQPGIGYRV